MRLRSIAVLTVLLLAISPTANSYTALTIDQIPGVFKELTANRALANPAVVLIDIKSRQVVFSRDGNGLRRPASTLKVLSAMSALDYLEPTTTFSTTIYKTDLRNTFQIVGQFDPSITPDYQLAKSENFIWSNFLVNKIRANSKSRNITIRYYGITSRTQINMSNTFRRLGYRVAWRPVNQANSTTHLAAEITSVNSPDLATILKHTLLWSENYYAEYLARIAAMKAGYTYDGSGINKVFHDVLNKAEIPNPELSVKDGSGLSGQNKISALTLAQTLVKIYDDPKYKTLIEGLPVGGVSGTLKSRFLNTAPQGVGLVRAKTGTLNGVVNLAGYIDSGVHEYAFVVIADHVRHSLYAEANARATIDRILGKIAQPLIIAQYEPVPEESPAPVTSVTG